MNVGMGSYFQEGVRAVMQTEDESSHSYHVVDVGESGEHNANHMMDKHHQEVLGRDGRAA